MNKYVKLDTNIKITLAIVGGFILALVMIPVLFVLTLMIRTEEGEAKIIEEIEEVEEVIELEEKYNEEEYNSNFYITVYRTETSEFQTMDFERYLIGVVAAEMPALFELDALRAQAIAARTYAMRILVHDDYILDAEMHQVFLDDDQLKKRWGKDFDLHFEKIEEAVTSTNGIVLMYDDDLITPMFFAMSSGATENSEDVFGTARPYLRSVVSTGYEERTNFAVCEIFTIDDLREAFDDNSITADNIYVLGYSEGGNVDEVAIGEGTYTGRKVREILGLRSAAFSIGISRRGIVFTTYGHGHGVGMSQHGANAMAREGYDYVEILNHFYQNVTLKEKNFTEYE